MNTLGLGVFVAATVYVCARWGLVILLRDWLWLWILALLLAISLTDLRRYARGLLVDWLPFIAIIVAYDLLRGIADPGVAAAHWGQQIEVEHALFAGKLPTLWLQYHLFDPHHHHVLAPYDYVVWGVYNTHFATTLVVAAVLWRTARERFLEFRTMVAALALSGMATFAAFPTLPPWLASRQGHIHGAHRIVEHVWHHVGVSGGPAIFEHGAKWANQVAALPSLHAAYPMLLLLFFRDAKWPVRAALVAYLLLMAFALVYSGEHYVVDIFGGWLYAAGAFLGVKFALRLLERRRPSLATT
jgi:membrane-associated phospholipid phosphatase